MKKYNIAVIGATGLIGRTFLKVLEDRNFPINNLYLFSSSRSAGSKLIFKNKEYIVEELKVSSFTNSDIEIALFSAGGSVSKKFATIASANGILVIDNSSYWRMDPNVPLVVAEVNPEEIKKHQGIIANPNCSTIQALVPLKPLDDKYKIKRIVYSTYQAVSGSGIKGLEDLEKGIIGNPTGFYPCQISYNCIPHINSFTANGYTREELKMINETKKILNNYNLKITATTVRVPVKNVHSESLNVEFENNFKINDVTKTLESSPGVVVIDNIHEAKYPTVLDADGKDEVFVGRIRRDFSVDSGINMWVVADNARKGAATNTIQIAEKAIEYGII